jgi:Glycosyltransferase like family 2
MAAENTAKTGELAEYLRQLHRWCDDVIVVDGSAGAVFENNARALAGIARHVAPDPGRRERNGKVLGVLTGLAIARHDRVVIADDDVRYDPDSLRRTVLLLTDHDLVSPQNYFSPTPWHAVWDTARTLLNRATIGGDFPGTLAVRRSTLQATGEYDGDVLFENLELIRTVRAFGGNIASPLDLYIRRLPPTAAAFVGQRTRQAYDEFALPLRMTIWLGALPALGLSLARRGPKPPIAAAALIVLLAERGRRRAGGTRVFPIAASLLAPLWMLERGCCAWLAVLERLRFGGMRYHGSILRVAAHSERALEARIQNG